MKKSIFIILIIILLSLIFYFIVSETKLINIQIENSNLLKEEKNLGLEKHIKINLDVETNNIKRIGIADSRHHEVTNIDTINQILDILNDLTFKRCAKNSKELGFIYKVVIYSEKDVELFNFVILSDTHIKFKNVEYKVTNGTIDYNKITQLLGGSK